MNFDARKPRDTIDSKTTNILVERPILALESERLGLALAKSERKLKGATSEGKCFAIEGIYVPSANPGRSSNLPDSLNCRIRHKYCCISETDSSVLSQERATGRHTAAEASTRPPKRR